MAIKISTLVVLVLLKGQEIFLNDEELSSDRNEKNQGSITALAYSLLRVWVAEEVEEVEVSAAHVPFRLHRLRLWL